MTLFLVCLCKFDVFVDTLTSSLVAFQYLASVALFVLNPVGYFLSLIQKSTTFFLPFSPSLKTPNHQNFKETSRENKLEKENREVVEVSYKANLKAQIFKININC